MQCFICKQAFNLGDIYIEYDQKSFHQEHFNCKICNKELGEDPFYETEAAIYCEADYLNNFCPQCFKCKQPIQENQYYFQQISKQSFHKECFHCQSCQNILANGQFYQLQNKSQQYCLNCIKYQANKCKQCKKPIIDKGITLDSQTSFHLQCFKCVKCRKEFKNNTYILFEQQQYHQDCLQPHQLKCEFCKLDIPLDENFYEISTTTSGSIIKGVHLECIEKYDQLIKQNIVEEIETVKFQQLDRQSLQKEEIFVQKQQQSNQQQQQQQQLIQEKSNPQLAELKGKFEQKKQQSSSLQGLKQKAQKLQLLNEEEKIQNIEQQQTSSQIQSEQDILTGWNSLPKDVIQDQKEMHLSDEEFQYLFKMNKEQFSELQKWKQVQIKKDLKLF